MKTFKLFLIFITALQSILASEFLETRGVGIGGALRSAYSLNESLYSNPASPAFLKSYSIEGTYQTNDYGKDRRGDSYHLTVVDNSASAFAAGIGYMQRKINDSQSKQKETSLNLNLSKIIAPNLSFGVGGKYYSRNKSNVNKSQYNLDTGVLYIITENFKIGLLGQNLIKDKDDILFTEVGGGIALSYLNQYFLYTDVAKRFNSSPIDKYSFHVGTEIVQFADFVLRGGWNLDQNNNQQFLSGGIGWMGPKLGAFYSYRNAIAGNEETDHSFSLRLFF